MLWTNIKRVVRSGFVGFWRNSFVSLSAILVMTFTLFFIGLLVFTGVMLNATLDEIRNKVDINVYFVLEAPEEEILALKSRIEVLPEVQLVEYVSREEALERFRERHTDDALTIQALNELGQNPFGAALAIKAKEPSQYAGIAQVLEEESALSAESGAETIIDRINYFQNKAAIDKLSAVIDSAELFGLIISIFLITASILITFNTIRLAIYTARDEIHVMRLVGASYMYIRGPFVFEGIMYGVVAGFITLLLLYPLTLWLGPYTEAFFSNINLFNYFVSHFGELFLLIVGGGILLGAVSSFLAVRKYLKV